ncbi:MAG: thioredoxin family protein, partial [Planctomycetes bacterium]|nr:thioredoxin family protein [Planctomycetota bacterium]
VGGAWLVVAGLAGAGWGPAPAQGAASVPEGIHWVSDLEDAGTRARSEGRPMLVDFYSRACIPCREMDATVLRDPRVVAEARRFVAVKLDIGADEVASRLRLERYGSAQLPLYVFHDSQGRELPGARRGKTDVEDFLNVMRSVK